MYSSFGTKKESKSCNKRIKKNKNQGKINEKVASNKKGISTEYCKQIYIRKTIINIQKIEQVISTWIKIKYLTIIS